MPDPGTVIVTGGASGLGAAVAGAISDAGGLPLVVDLNPPTRGYEHELVDLSDTAAAEQAVERLAERHGGLDAVVTAAGVDFPGPLAEIPRERWERVVAVNLLGTAAVVRAALPYLDGSGGKVVTVASTLGLRAFADATAYCASKFGVIGFSRALAAELAGRIGVTCLVTGGMETHFFDGRDPKYQPAPDADLQPPQEVANAVMFALGRENGSELRELVVCPPTETSWP